MSSKQVDDDDVMLWCDGNVRYVVMGFLIFTNQKSNSLMIDSFARHVMTIFIWVETITVPFENISAWPNFRTGGQNWISLHISSAATNSSTINSSTINKSTNNIIAPTGTEAGAAPRLLRDVSEWVREGGRVSEWTETQHNKGTGGWLHWQGNKTQHDAHADVLLLFFPEYINEIQGEGEEGEGRMRI